MTNYYTGVGSRSTPAEVLLLMTAFSKKSMAAGWILRSGAAKGADTAFEKGAGFAKEIFIPWKSFSNDSDHVLVGDYPEAEKLAAAAHPAWHRCSPAAKLLHTRNACQVLGYNLKTPSKFLLCWAPPTKDGVEGGTNTAWQIAKQHNIRCFNLALDKDRQRVEIWLGM